MRFESRQQTVVIEERRTQVGHRLPNGVHRILEQTTQLLECRGMPALPTRKRGVAEGLQPDPERGQVLTDKIVQIGGNAPALGLLGRGQAPQQRPHAPLAIAQRTFGTQALGHVAPHAPVAQKRAARVEERIAVDFVSRT